MPLVTRGASQAEKASEPDGVDGMSGIEWMYGDWEKMSE